MSRISESQKEKQHDILFSQETFDEPIIEDGDFVIGESTDQETAHLLIATLGEFRHSPYIGVGLINYVENELAEEILPEILRQFKVVGLNIEELNFLEGKGVQVKTWKPKE